MNTEYTPLCREDQHFLQQLQDSVGSLCRVVNPNTILRLVMIDNFIELYWIDPDQKQQTKHLATHFAGDWVPADLALFSVANMFLKTEHEFIELGIEKLKQAQKQSV